MTTETHTHDDHHNRTYSLDEAAKELNLDRETIARLLPKLSEGSQREGDRISEDALNEIVDMLNNDPDTAADVPRM